MAPQARKQSALPAGKYAPFRTNKRTVTDSGARYRLQGGSFEGQDASLRRVVTQATSANIGR